MSSESTKVCPMCGRGVPAPAPECPHCGERFHTDAIEGGIRPTAVEASLVLERTWQLFGEHGALAILAAVTGFFVPLAINVALQLLTDQFAGGLIVPGPQAPFVRLAITTVVTIVQNAIGLYFSLGQTLFLLKLSQGKPAPIGDLLGGRRFFVRGVLAMLVLFLALFGAGMLCFLPAIVVAAVARGLPSSVFAAFACGLLVYAIVAVYVMLRIFPYQCYLIDQNCGPIEALRGAYEITSRNQVTQFVVVILLLLGTLIAGTLMLCVGLVVTLAFWFQLQVVAYLLMCGRRVGRAT